jgi:outer membrane lipoprotein-sorting protein
MSSRPPSSRRHAALALWIAGFGAAMLANGADDLDAAFDRIDRASITFKGLSANVTQVSHNAVLNEDESLTGTMAVRLPKPHELRALVDIRKPDAKQVFLTGHKVELYYPKTKTVQIIDLDRKGSALVDQFLLLGFGSNSAEIRKSYDVECGGPETVAGQKTVRLVLVPRSADLRTKLTKVELWISDTLGLAVQQKFWEPGGDYTLATYTNMRLNPSSLELKWELPKDVHRENLNK